ncbi:MAG: hypothetical protein ACI9LV_000469 [Candidatus Nanohaloarchaea archaeon]|jgi:hypothetical protein
MPDFLASLALFGVVVSIFLFSWNAVISNQGDFSESEQMREEAYYTATFLVSTKGYPSDWNSSTVEIPGFASSDNIIEPEKLSEFRNISYRQQKLLLQAQNYRLVFRNTSGIINLNGKPLDYGLKPANPSNTVVINRNVLIDFPKSRKEAEMRYIVWN